MRIAIVKETEELEKRVSASPETVKKLISLGFSVDIEDGAGENSFYSNEDYKNAGANIIADTKSIISSADIVLKVNSVHKDGKGADDINNYNKGTKVIGFLKIHFICYIVLEIFNIVVHFIITIIISSTCGKVSLERFNIRI